MFISFFKKIGLSIALLFAPFNALFHKPKPCKPKSMLTKEEVSSSEFIITSTSISQESFNKILIEPEIVEPTLKEKIEAKELELKKLRKEKKKLKKKRKEQEYAQWKKDQIAIMKEIDIRIARQPKKMETLDTWHLTENEMDAIIEKPRNIKITYINENEPNNIFV